MFNEKLKIFTSFPPILNFFFFLSGNNGENNDENEYKKKTRIKNSDATLGNLAIQNYKIIIICQHKFIKTKFIT